MIRFLLTNDNPHCLPSRYFMWISKRNEWNIEVHCFVAKSHFGVAGWTHSILADKEKKSNKKLNGQKYDIIYSYYDDELSTIEANANERNNTCSRAHTLVSLLALKMNTFKSVVSFSFFLCLFFSKIYSHTHTHCFLVFTSRTISIEKYCFFFVWFLLFSEYEADRLYHFDPHPNLYYVMINVIIIFNLNNAFNMDHSVWVWYDS